MESSETLRICWELTGRVIVTIWKHCKCIMLSRTTSPTLGFPGGSLGREGGRGGGGGGGELLVASGVEGRAGEEEPVEREYFIKAKPFKE